MEQKNVPRSGERDKRTAEQPHARAAQRFFPEEELVLTILLAGRVVSVRHRNAEYRGRFLQIMLSLRRSVRTLANQTLFVRASSTVLWEKDRDYT